MKEIFQAIAAKVDDGAPCCDWVGENGAGHYVKMVHNGIEYGDMQLICEAYQLMKDGLGHDADEMHEVFDGVEQGRAGQLPDRDHARHPRPSKDDDGEPMVDKILDTAGQKGTGKWTGISSLDLGMPVTLIGEAVFARCLSAMKDERVRGVASADRPERASSRATARPSSRTCASALYCSKMSPTRRATCCCARPPRNTSGT